MKELEYLEYSEKLLKDLEAIDIITGMDPDSIRELVSLCKYRECKKGDRIISEGEYDSSFFFLISGSVEVSSGNEVISVLKRKGDLFGEMGIIDGRVRSANVTAKEDKTTCLIMDASVLDRLSKEGKDRITAMIYRTLAEAVAEKLRKANDEMVHLKEHLKAITRLVRK